MFAKAAVNKPSMSKRLRMPVKSLERMLRAEGAASPSVTAVVKVTVMRDAALRAASTVARQLEVLGQLPPVMEGRAAGYSTCTSPKMLKQVYHSRLSTHY